MRKLIEAYVLSSTDEEQKKYAAKIGNYPFKDYYEKA